MRPFQKIIIFLVLLVCSTIVSSQEYYPFPEDNAVWNTVGDNLFSGEEFRIRFGLYGDTVINSTTYQKLFELYDTTLIHPNSTFFGGIRNEDKKVYLLMEGYPESILYDFSLTVGDTIWYEIGGGAYSNGYEFWTEEQWRTVVSIDSVLIENGQYRKRWEIEGQTMPDTWIEGVGSVQWFGLLNPLITSILLNGDGFQFACLTHNDQWVYQENPQCDACFCQLMTPVEKTYEMAENLIDVYPNPATDQLSLKINGNQSSIYLAGIYNSSGSIIMEFTLKGSTVSNVSLKGIPGGLYMVKIMNENNGRIGSRKLIIK